MNTPTAPKSKRQGGRKQSPYPEFLKKLRATQEEYGKFLELLEELNPTRDARTDFEIIMQALKSVKTLKDYSHPRIGNPEKSKS